MSIEETRLLQAPPCPGGTLYTIRPGDTFFALAARFGTNVEALAAANPGIDPRNLQIGQVICIPGAPVPCPGGFAHTIRPGDTFFLLAQRFGVSVAALLAANPQVDPDNLQVGQTVCIPSPPIPGPGPLCCVTLSVVADLPPSQLFPGGVALIKPAATAAEAVTVTFAAESLPPPSDLGAFDAYAGQVAIPAPAPEPPAVFGIILVPVRTDNRTTWAGTRVVPEEIPAGAAFEIRVINTAIGARGIAVLRGFERACVSA